MGYDYYYYGNISHTHTYADSIDRSQHILHIERGHSISCTVCDLWKLVNKLFCCAVVFSSIKHWKVIYNNRKNHYNIQYSFIVINATNHYWFCFFCFLFGFLQQLFRSQNPNLASNTGVPPPGQPGGQPLPQTLPLPSQQYLAQQSAAYAAAAQQAAPYVINPGQDAAQYMGLIAAAGMPQYYGVAPWGVYPANLIPQQGTQPRRPLTPSQQAGENQPSYQVGTFVHHIGIDSI